MAKQEKKDFRGWMEVKEKIHNAGRLRSINEGDIWWYAAGENVRTEMNGKIPFVFQNKNEVAALHQLRNIDVSRLYDKIGQVPASDLRKVINGLRQLLWSGSCF